MASHSSHALVTARAVIRTEIIACAGLIVALVRELVVTGVQSTAFTIALCVSAAVLAVALGFGIRALSAGSRGARGPLVTWQLLQGVVAANFLTENHSTLVTWLLVVTIAVSVTGLLAIIQVPVDTEPTPDPDVTQPESD